MRAVALAFLLSFSAHAQDVPLRDPAPVVDLTPEEKLAVAKYIVALETENVELKKGLQSQMHPLVFAGIIVLSVASGFAIGYGVSTAIKK